MKLYKKDIKRIGYAIDRGDEGNTIFTCYGKIYNVEVLLLREILDLYGYKILDEIDSCYEGDIEIITNMPFEEYSQV